MSYRLQIALVFLAPVLLVGGLFVFGMSVPVPVLGRGYVVRIALPEAGTQMKLPPVQGPDDPARPLVVIDAGHGGHDPGAAGGGYEEKDITLGLARALRDELLRTGGIRVALTRDDDRFLVLSERSEIARQLGASLFLSIHADSAGDQAGISGASIYTLSDEASSEAAERFAARENSVDVVNGVPLMNANENVNAILVELSQRHTQERSARFSALLRREGEGVIAFHPQASRSASLAVLRAPDVPSALFESGFITNPEDAGRLASPEGRAAFARATSRAIRIFLAREAAQ